MSQPRWIKFKETGGSTTGKTRTWDVASKTDGHHLGTVQWLASWRQYVFVPLLRDEDDPMSYYVYNAACLREIAFFIEARTVDHRIALARARKIAV